MKNTKRIKGAVILAFFMVLLSGILIPHAAKAASSADTIYKKVLIGGMRNCYNSTKMNSSVTLKVSEDTDYKNPKSIFPSDSGLAVLLPTMLKNDYIKHNDDTFDITCEELFDGLAPSEASTFDGLLKAFGKSALPSSFDTYKEEDYTNTDNALVSMGYSKRTKSATRCVEIRVKDVTESDNEPEDVYGYVCWANEEVMLNTEFAAQELEKDAGDAVFIPSASYDEWWASRFTPPVETQPGYGLPGKFPIAVDPAGGEEGEYILPFHECYNSPTFRVDEDGIDDFQETCEMVALGYEYEFSFTFHNSPPPALINEPTLPMGYSYDIYNYDDARYAAIKNLDESFVNNIELTLQEKFDLYAGYMSSLYNVSLISKDGCSSDQPSSAPTADNPFMYLDKGWCKIKYTDIGIKASGFSKTLNEEARRQFGEIAYVYSPVLDKRMGPVDVLQEMYYLALQTDLSPVSSSGGGIVVPIEDDEGGEGTVAEDDPCYTSSGSLGWILCPLVQKIGDTLKSLYKDTIKGYMTIDAFLLTPGNGDSKGSGTYQAWRVFVDFGNIILVVFFLIIIFSQVTGVGIDNYGIKKALPKVIIAAILINASYLICQLAADLSNIIGSSLESLLADIGDGLEITNVAGVHISDGSFFEFILNFTMLTAGAIAVGSFVYNGINNSWVNAIVALIIPLAIAMLVALIAILFFFVLLGMRKAAVVVLVAVSPVALACYMLPNMKKFVFDRWFKLFKTMLVAYPICGLLVGGSGLASAILVSSGLDKNFLFFAIIMLLMVVPFFLLPSIIKNSMGVLGALTQRASTFARGLGRKGEGRLSNAWKNSDRYKQRQAFGQEERMRRRANRNINRLSGRTARTARGQRALDARLAEARTTLDELDAKGKQRELRSTEGWQTGRANSNTLATAKEADETTRLADAAYVQAATREQELSLQNKAEETMMYGSNSFYTGARTEQRLARQDKMEKTRQFSDRGFARGKQFVQREARQNDFLKTRRFDVSAPGGIEARTSLINRLNIDRDKEAWDDRLYSTSDTLAAGLASNRSRAQAKLAENFASRLSAGTLKSVRTGQAVNRDNQDSLKIAHEEAVAAFAALPPGTSADSLEFQSAVAQITALENEMMKADAGRTNIAKDYASVADSVAVTGNNDAANRVRTAMSNFLGSHGKDEKLHHRGNFQFLTDAASTSDIMAFHSVVDKQQKGKYALTGLGSMDSAKLKEADDASLDGIAEGIKDAVSRVSAAIAAKTAADSDDVKAIKEYLTLAHSWNSKSGQGQKPVVNERLFDKVKVSSDVEKAVGWTPPKGSAPGGP